MIQGLENLETKHKVKLTIPLVAGYLARGVNRMKIAKLCNISDQAVYDYCDRHYEELAPLIYTSDSILAIKSKHIAEKSQIIPEFILSLSITFHTLNHLPHKLMILLTSQYYLI